MIAALAWNLKTWLLNLLRLGGGDAVPALSLSVDLASRGGREERPQYGRAELPAGEYFQRFGVAMARLAILS